MKDFNLTADVLGAEVHIRRMIEYHRPHFEEPSEEGGHAPELILAPVLVGMIVALGAIEAASEEHADLFRHRIGGRSDAIERNEVA